MPSPRRGGIAVSEPAARRPRASAAEVVRGAYSISAFGLWGAAIVMIVRFGGPLLTTGAAIAEALTRTSVALEHVAQDAGAAREATARLEQAAIRAEAHAVRVESELAAMRTQLAEIRGATARR